VMEVTAAHEMLHVAYQRMSIFEQTHINQQLQVQLSKLQNPRILKLVGTYNRQDSRSVDNELHSILGTEVQNLSPKLEEHYRQYFTDRSSIVALSERYEGVFTTLKEKAKTLTRELETQKVGLERLAAQVKQESASIDSERANLESTIAANPQADYQFRISSFEDRVNSYNQLVAQLRAQSDAYNRAISESNSLTVEHNSLVDSLENKSK
jgi:chromosome segregation ATPase